MYYSGMGKASIALILLLTSCSTLDNYGQITETPVAKIRSQVTIETSQLGKTVEFRGPEIRTYAFSASDSLSYYLHGLKPKSSNDIRHQLYVHIEYEHNWKLFETAKFQDGESVQLTVIDREVKYCRVSSCRFREIVDISLPLDWLRLHQEAGFTVKLDSQHGGNVLVSVPGNYVQGYLSAIN